ncbi:hypothetical protein WHR41_05714 [Cladosporium halotolerans]|uniref:DNA replication checkpoint mediator MRC1 domain-containing protein n=1 Tax=Cladosporium halotolerans TaxID=1052096 RepID=A0AB34KQE9_9PEZI
MAAERSSPPPSDQDAIDLGDDYLSPRSKINKMLAEIDEAPTPSPPTERSTVQPNTISSGPFQDDSEDGDELSGESPTRSAPATRTSSHPNSEAEEDEGIVRRPQGRAARRMLGIGGPGKDSEADSENDLYSATPLRNSSSKRRRDVPERTGSGSPLGSQSQRGTGLFVSPAKTTLEDSDGEDDLPGPNRLAELVAQKRAERLAKENEKRKNDKARKTNAESAAEHVSSDLPEEVFQGSQDAPANPDVDRILSDAARPTRKASKKAMLEMERETQRLARQQALAHQIKVKKKFSTSDLLARFNFRQPQDQAVQADKPSSSMPSSDGIEASPGGPPKEPVSTPPSSPPTPFDKQRMLVERGALTKMIPVREDTLTSMAAEEDQQELLDVDKIVKSPTRRKQEADVTEPSASREQGSKIARWGRKSAPQTYRDDESDDDLEVLQPLPKHLQVFDRVKPIKKQEAHSSAIHNLRHLSHLGHTDAKPNRPTNVKPSVHPQVLEARLRKKAREQAFEAQQERLAELKVKGIVIQTAEEKEKEAEEFENLLEKARLDAQNLRKAEKAANKEAKSEGNMEASDDETEDEDYYDQSGDEEAGEDDDADGGNELLDDAADESEEEEEEHEEDEEAEEDVGVDDDEMEADQPHEDPSKPAASRKARKSHIIQDDEDDDDKQEEADKTTSSTAAAPASANDNDKEDDPFAAFGFGAAKADVNMMSATQAFNATMEAPSQEMEEEDSFDILQYVPPPGSAALPPSLPAMDTHVENDESQTQFVTGPSVAESQEVQLGWDTQAPETPAPALTRKQSDLSETPGWEPTQDPGLPSPWTGLRRGQLQRESTLVTAAEDDHETQSTVQLRVSESPAQAAPRRGRLQQRKQLAADDSEDEAEPALPSQKDAFKEMKRRRLDDLNAGDRLEANAEMKRMMDDQAEESEDEYAGLGGDDTEMIAPETAEDQAMIDSSHIEVDEREIAAHHAARERVAEEEATKKLYKDITTGAFRRRQRGAWDLDEDEDDYIARRRQMRLREETRKRKLLLQDENVKGWAETGKHSKGKDAFLKAIADDDEQEAEDAIDLEEEEKQDTEDQSTQQTQPEVDGVPLQEISGNKRPAEDGDDSSQARPPAKQRRVKEADAAFSRPTSINQVRESLSFLLDEPDQTLVGPSVMDDESDLEIEDEPTESGPSPHDSDYDEIEAEMTRQNDGGFAPNPKSMEDKAMMPPPARLPGPQRRTAAKPAVVDRLSLKRGSSSSTSADGRSAWATGGSSGGASKTPSLLRRATTNIASAGANDRGITTGGGNDRGVTIGGGARVGGNKKSSLAYQARAEERRTIVEASARRRAENTAKIAELRRANSSSMARMGFAGGSGFE